jgi:hypothetical protein
MFMTIQIQYPLRFIFRLHTVIYYSFSMFVWKPGTESNILLSVSRCYENYNIIPAIAKRINYFN